MQTRMRPGKSFLIGSPFNAYDWPRKWRQILNQEGQYQIRSHGYLNKNRTSSNHFKSVI